MRESPTGTSRSTPSDWHISAPRPRLPSRPLRHSTAKQLLRATTEQSTEAIINPLTLARHDSICFWRLRSFKSHVSGGGTVVAWVQHLDCCLSSANGFEVPRLKSRQLSWTEEDRFVGRTTSFHVELLRKTFKLPLPLEGTTSTESLEYQSSGNTCSVHIRTLDPSLGGQWHLVLLKWWGNFNGFLQWNASSFNCRSLNKLCAGSTSSLRERPSGDLLATRYYVLSYFDKLYSRK